MADPSLAGLVNVLSASQAGVGGNPVGDAQLQQLVQRLGGWATQPGVPVQMHGLPASFMDHLNSGGTKTYPSGAFGLGGGGGGTPPPSVVNPGLGTGGQPWMPGPTPERPPRTGETGTVVSPPGTPRNPETTPGYTNATGNGGETRVPITTGNPAAQFPTPLTNRNAAGSTTAAQATGMIKYVDGKATVVPIPEQYKNMAIPWQYVGQPLPAGAFTSLWTNSQGTDWTKIRPG